jgi:F-type H+-transporting ATPase subunit epsilon
MADLPTSLQLEVATPLGMAVSLQTDSVQAPGAAGEFGVLPGHVPLLAALKPGILTYRHDGKMLRAAIGAGYAEATADHVRVITEYFQKREDINVEQARKDLADAEAKMKEIKATIEDVAYQEVERELQWAQTRLELANSASN